jgi:hypothetical protein
MTSPYIGVLGTSSLGLFPVLNSNSVGVIGISGSFNGAGEYGESTGQTYAGIEGDVPGGPQAGVYGHGDSVTGIGLHAENLFGLQPRP